MKRKRNIQGIFKKNSVEAKLKDSVITNITEYDGNINDMNVFYEYQDAEYQISFTDGDVSLAVETTTTTAPAETTTTTAPAETTTTTAPAETTTTTTTGG